MVWFGYVEFSVEYVQGHRVGEMPLFIISMLVSSVIMGGALQMVWGADDPSIRLIVEDILSKPGKPVQLTAHLLRGRNGDPGGVEGEEIAFFVFGKEAGTAVTAKNGTALIEFSTPMRGNHPIKAVHLPSKAIPKVEGFGNLASWERRRPVLFIDVKTLLDGQGQEVTMELTRKNWPTPREGAIKELQKVGEFYYNVIYIIWNHDVPKESLRDWLRMHEFPVGLTLVLEPGVTGLAGFIEGLQEKGWNNIEAGIGSTSEFAEVLVKHRILAVILPKTEGAKFPRRAKVISHWKYVRKHL
ncbi:MAG: Ig-like domain-containing protein [Nitrospirae bacterium]|nr:Ig-like domain-containing protein [Nitrospirota bacterium]